MDDDEEMKQISRLVHIWVKTFRTCPHLGKNVPNLSTFGPSQRQLPIKTGKGTKFNQSYKP
ncbi:hypothetical protein LXL04_021799 [Taraxacum kok-saghyz]